MSTFFPETGTQIDAPAQTEITFDGPQANFADDAETRQYVLDNVAPLVTQARLARQALDTEWLEIQKMAFMRHGSNQAYHGMSNAYVPSYAKNLDARVRNISKSLFPTNDYLMATAYGEEFRQLESAAKAWMQYQLGTQAKLRARMKSCLRQLHDFGVTVGKVWYQKAQPAPGRGRLKKNPLGELLAAFDPSPEADTYCEGIRFRTVSMFAWHIWPLTINNIDEASLVFEDMQVSKQFADVMMDRGEWKNKEALAMRGLSDTDSKRAEQLQTITGLSDTAIEGMHGALSDWLEITEAYCRIPIPKKHRLQGEEDLPVPVQIIMCGDEPVCVRRNPFWFAAPPYALKTLNERAESLYGIGLGRQAYDLQGLVNDFINQTNDNGIYALNPIAKVNPNIVTKMGKIEPGSVWAMSDPKGLEFDRPPGEQIQYGHALTNQGLSLMTDLLGTPPQMQGQAGGGSAKTATGAQILQQNIRTDIQDVVEEIEEEFLEPLMEKVFALGQQYESADRRVVVAGAPINIPREVFAGGYAFKWMASSQTANNVMRNQQLLQLHQTMAATAQLLAMEGKKYVASELLRKLYQDGLGFRDFDRIVVNDPMAAMAAMGGGPGAPAPGAPSPGGEGAEGGPQVTSAVDQAQYGQAPSEMTQGEGEAFGEVRAGANDVAALMGGSNGKF